MDIRITNLFLGNSSYIARKTLIFKLTKKVCYSKKKGGNPFYIYFSHTKKERKIQNTKLRSSLPF